MHAPTPSFIQANEFRNRELLANAAQHRFVASVPRSGDRELQPGGLRRVAAALAYARGLASSLAAGAFGASAN